MQNRHVPSFLLTNKMGEEKGLVLRHINPVLAFPGLAFLSHFSRNMHTDKVAHLQAQCCPLG